MAVACFNLYEDETARLKPSDLVHLGYAMAYDLDYLIATDKDLRQYRAPNPLKLVVKHPKDVGDILALLSKV